MKIVIIIVAILIGIPLIIWVIGSFLPESHSVTVSRMYQAAPEEIYRVLTDVGNFSSWRKNVKEVKVLSNPGESKKWREYYSDNDPLTFRIVEQEEDKLIVTEIADQDLPFGGQWTYQIEKGENSATLRITENGEVYNPIFRFVSKFIIGHDATINQFLTDLEGKINKG